MIPSDRELANIRRHADHFTIIAAGAPAQRRFVLDSADANLVRALGTATRIAHHDGAITPDTIKKHRRKIQTMMSPTKALRTKLGVVTGQRGGGFFSSIIKAALPAIGSIVGSMAGPLGGIVGGAAGKVIGDAV